MKYISDVTGKVYETVEALEKDEAKVTAEKEAKEKALAEKKAQRESRAKEVETAIKEALDAQEHATNLLQSFCKDYGTFHTSIKNANALLGNLDPFHNFFKTYWGF